MKLEQSDSSLIFSTTQIPDVFFTEYLSFADGNYIKIYLYMVFLSKYSKDIKVNDLAKTLQLPLKTIQDGIKFWEEQHVLTKKNTGYVLNNLQEIELHKLYNPKITSSPEELEKTAKNQYRSKAIENINNDCFNGVMSPSWYSDIDLWFKKYNFDEEVMIALFRYCFNRSALHRNYIQTVAEAWCQNKIKTFNDLELYFEKQEKIKTLGKTISKKLNLNRQLSQYEEGYIARWNIDYGYSFDIIEMALKKTTSKASFNFDYLDKILTDWHDRKLKTPTDVQTFLAKAKTQTQNIKKLEKQTGYTNYEQRDRNDWDNFYANTNISTNPIATPVADIQSPSTSYQNNTSISSNVSPTISLNNVDISGNLNSELITDNTLPFQNFTNN